MRKINFFKAERELSNIVVNYMQCKVWKKAIQLEYAKKIDALKVSIENLDKLEGSLLAEKSAEMRTLYLAQIAEYESERDAQIEKEAKFVLTENDKKFKKAIRKADTASDLQAKAVCDWFDVYGLDVSDSYFLDEILAYFGGKFDFKKFVKTNAQDARSFDSSKALEMLYCSAYTHMLRVGTIKETQIPEIVREKYAPKKASKKSK